MRRLAIATLGFTAFGAAASVAVAWLCAARGETRLVLRPMSFDNARIAIESMDILGGTFQVSGTDTECGFGLTSTLTEAVVDVGDEAVPTHAIVMCADGGWPVHSLRGAVAIVGFGSTSPRRVARGIDVPGLIQRQDVMRTLPIRPLWIGLVIDTIFYGSLSWVLICSPRAIRRVTRCLRGHCVYCAYPIADSTICSECGRTHSRVRLQAYVHTMLASARSTPLGRLSIRCFPVLILAVLLGAIANLVMAWGCAVMSPDNEDRVQARAPFSPPTNSDVNWWSRHAPAKVGPPSAVRHTALGPAKVIIRMSEHGQHDPIHSPGSVVGVVRTGWPALSMEYALWKVPVTQADETAQGMLMVPRVLPGMKATFVPLRPVMPGVAINTFAYATAIYLLFGAIVKATKWVHKAPFSP